MRHLPRYMAMIAASVGLATLPIARAAIQDQQPVVQRQQVVVEHSASDLQQQVDAIEHAPDPSTAVTVYAAAKAAVPDNPKIDQAYIRKMVDFGLPQMAEAQAHTLVQNNPKDGLAWGVLAFSLATRDQTTEALQDIAHAAKYLPDDPFIQRTAGQLLAWYDTMADTSALPSSLKNEVQTVRNEMASHRAYVDAYQAARQAYEQGPYAAETGPTGTQLTPPASTEQPLYTGDMYGYDNGYLYEPYVYPYPNYLYPDYLDYFPYWGGYYGGYWWPGPYSTVIVPGGGFVFHHHHHGPDLNDFLGFPGNRFVNHGLFHGFAGHGLAGRGFVAPNHGTFGHFGAFPQGNFVGNHAFANRAPQFNRGFVGRAPQFNRGFAGRAPLLNRGFAGRAPQIIRGPHFGFAPHAAPQHFAAPRIAGPRFAAAPHFGGAHFGGAHFGGAHFGGGHFGGGHFGGAHFGGGHFGGGHFGGGRR